MRFTYEQFGPVALIYEDGQAVCVAKLEHDGLWVAETDPLLGETRRPLYQCRPCHSASSLDALVAEANQRYNSITNA
jgi:hypothetical protein